MRLLAPEGKGHPVLRGVEVKPEDDGTYHVNPDDGRMLVDTHGYIDADAPTKPKAKGHDVVRAAALAALEAFGVKLADPRDELIVKALGDLRKIADEEIKRAEKETEDRVLKELADKNDGGKKK
jgi:hypothetical protein